MIKHIVMWNVLGASADEKRHNTQKLKAAFESLRGAIPGLLTLEIGVDQSRVDYACDVVLYSEFDSADALAAYAEHPEHTRVRQALEGLRIARHQVDYLV
jgi:heme-degrading monooxygenase HmoA